MADFYDGMAEVARQLIKEFGRDITITETQSQKWTPGADPNPQITEHPAKGLFREVKQQLVEGKEVVRKDANFLVAGLGLDFMLSATNSHIVDADGQQYKVLRVNELKPGNQVMYYEVFVRKAG